MELREQVAALKLLMPSLDQTLPSRVAPEAGGAAAVGAKHPVWLVGFSGVPGVPGWGHGVAGGKPQLFSQVSLCLQGAEQELSW